MDDKDNNTYEALFKYEKNEITNHQLQEVLLEMASTMYAALFWYEIAEIISHKYETMWAVCGTMDEVL